MGKLSHMIPRMAHWIRSWPGFFLGAVLLGIPPAALELLATVVAGTSNSPFDVWKVEVGLEQTTVTAILQTQARH